MFSNQTDCGTGWSQDTSFNSRYLYGSSSFGTLRYEHEHEIDDLTGYGVGTISSGDSSPDYCGQGQGLTYEHRHAVTAIIPETDPLPPYYNLLVCSSDNLLYTDKIGMFDNSLPSNWTRFSSLDNRFPRGYSSAGGLGGSTTHTHSNSFTINVGGVTDLPPGWGAYGDEDCYEPNSWETNMSHGHSYSSVSIGSATSIPPYLNLLFAENDLTNQAGVADMIIATSSLPPLGWERYTSLDNKLPRGSDTPGSTGGSSTHNHSYSLNIGSVTSSIGGANTSSGIYDYVRTTHTHGTLSGTSTSSSTVPPSKSVIFIKRNSTETSTVGAEESGNSAPQAPDSLLTEGQTNPDSITDTTPEFSAVYNDPDTSDTSSYYEIEVNTQSDFTGTVMWDSTKSSMTSTNQGDRSPNISYAGSSLSYNATYYWRIKFWDSQDEESPWSSTANFQLNRSPSAPTNLLTEGLTNPSAIKDLTPEFSAIFDDPDTTDTSSYYELEVNTASDFSGTVMWDTTKSSMTITNEGDRSPDISYTGDTLSTETTYYWRIKFWDSVDNESSWSSTASFKIDITPTASSLNTIGETDPTEVLDEIYFSAIYTDPNDDNSSNYEIEVNTASNFTGTVMWDSGKTAETITSGSRSPDIAYDGTELNYDGTTYYVRIRFWDTDDNVSEWTTGEFTDTLKSFQFNGLRMNGIQLN
jgi:hypothetical protein